jgi:hypothetical protein
MKLHLLIDNNKMLFSLMKKLEEAIGEPIIHHNSNKNEMNET